jgi:hypothetical protein
LYFKQVICAYSHQVFELRKYVGVVEIDLSAEMFDIEMWYDSAYPPLRTNNEEEERLIRMKSNIRISARRGFISFLFTAEPSPPTPGGRLSAGMPDLSCNHLRRR